MKYKFMKKYASEHCIRTMARVLGVSSSAYYRWLKTPISQRKFQDIQLIAKIKKYQEEFKFSYGGERLTRHIKKEEGIKLGHNRVSRLMKEHGLGAKRKIKWRKPKESKDLKSTIPNLLARKFDVSKPNTVWVSDISYIKTNRGWEYLCVIIDLHSRMIVGWSFENNMETTMVIEAFRRALSNRNYPKDVMFHTDRGSQYTSDDFTKEIKKNDFIQSMSRKGNCWDNACVESFFKSLKYEYLYPYGVKNTTETRLTLFEYIEVFYNKKRLHSTLGYLSPVEYEKKCA